MSKLSSTNGNISLTVIILVMILTILTIPMISVLYSTNLQNKSNLTRIENMYKLKAELCRIRCKLETEYDYLHFNPSGSTGILDYNVEHEEYSEESILVWNNATGQNDTVIISKTYIYQLHINSNSYKIVCKYYVDADITTVNIDS